MMTGRLWAPDDSGTCGTSSFVLSCVLSCALKSDVFKLVASDAAMAEPRNPRRLMDMNSPCSGSGEKNNTRAIASGAPASSEKAGVVCRMNAVGDAARLSLALASMVGDRDEPLVSQPAQCETRKSKLGNVRERWMGGRKLRLVI